MKKFDNQILQPCLEPAGDRVTLESGSVTARTCHVGVGALVRQHQQQCVRRTVLYAQRCGTYSGKYPR